ncbi:TetR/AcrR family transcriptional regulator [Paenibacillus sp. NPDC058071]|uniref:TetR/AcrR family transcriptional regulator n=1 Tax=Paenibacillus sp. NPDC058071 TaxID=3346326 RepID=UPI0036DB9BD6
MPTNNLFNDILRSQSGKRTVKQQRIVETAVQLFAEKGYSNTSTAEIAKAAEVSEASIFKQYGTKDNLLLNLIIPYIKDFFPLMANDLVLQATNNGDPTFEGFLRFLIRNRVQFITDNREIFQVLIKEIIYKEELKKELFPYFVEIVAPRVTKYLESFKERGELVDLPVDRILKMLFTFLGGFFASRFVLWNMESISDEEVEDAIRFIMNGLYQSTSDR